MKLAGITDAQLDELIGLTEKAQSETRDMLARYKRLVVHLEETRKMLTTDFDSLIEEKHTR